MTQPDLFQYETRPGAEMPALRAESPELADARRKRLLKKASKAASAVFSPPVISPDARWTLPALALHGIAGEIVREIEPKTEAHPAALLVTFLTAAGNILGRSCGIFAGNSMHHPRLFTAIIGATSKGRKGTSWQAMLPILRAADEDWSQRRIQHALASGEGLISAVRDPAPDDEDDLGEPDKRLLVFDEELGRTLGLFKKADGTLSAILRSAYDGNTLSNPTKNKKQTATEPHISIVGHITREELTKSLQETEVFNGLINRYLWVLTKRTRCLPETPPIDPDFAAATSARLCEIIEWARVGRTLTRSPEAASQWDSDYVELSDYGEKRAGVYAAVTGRAEAHVTRLSLLYAILDCSPRIELCHHLAAMALWEYCDRGARWIFCHGETGNPDADKILTALKLNPEGMSRTQISGEVFKRNASAAVIETALNLLESQGRAIPKLIETEGKSTEIWKAL